LTSNNKVKTPPGGPHGPRDAFTLKGFTGPVPVYRIKQTYRTRVMADQYIVITDLGGFSAVVETVPMTEVEKILNRLRELVGNVCRDFSC
jgi:class 3 adenylate cyclase